MSGTVSGFSTVGVTLVTNPTTITGTISTSGVAVLGSAAADWTLDNKGIVVSSQNEGVSLAGAGFVDNYAGGRIIGAYDGVGIYAGGSVLNAGTIDASAGFGEGVVIVGVGQITNVTGGIISGDEAVDLSGTGTILNQGSISGVGSYGFSVGIELEAGLISNASGGVISGNIGIDIAASATVENAGTIASTGASGMAVAFGGSVGNELVLDPGSTLIGTVDGLAVGDGIDLAGRAATSESFANGILTLTVGDATVATLALQGNFNTGEFVLGADGAGGTTITLGAETLTGNYAAGITLSALDTSIAASSTITNTGDAVFGSYNRNWALDNAGTLIAGTSSSYADGVDLGSSGLITNATGALIEGPTGVRFRTGTLVNAGTIASNTTNGVAIAIVASSSAATLILDIGSTLAGAVAGFETGDTIDLANLAVTGESFANGVLTLTDNGVVVDTLALAGGFSTGEFTLTPDQAGGTDIGIGASETISGTDTSGLTLSALYTTITPTGLISNSAIAIEAPAGRNWTLVNAGTVASSGGDAVNFEAGTLVNHGVLNGSSGVELFSSTLFNNGTISAIGTYGTGVEAFGTAVVTSGSAAIISGRYGAEIFGGSLQNAGSIIGVGYKGVGVDVGSGSMTNVAGGTITGVTGVRMSGGTAANAGSITAAGGASYYTYKDVGVALSGGTFTNLAGGVITGPSGVTVSGGLLLNQGEITGVAGGYKPGLYGGRYPADSRGVVLTGGMVTNAAGGTVAGVVGLELLGGTFTDAGTVASTATAAPAIAVAFGTKAVDLVLDQGAVVLGALSSFVSGDVIDFAGSSITSETFANGVLTLENAGVVLSTLALMGNFNSGDFVLSSDGAGGTNVTLGAQVLTGSYTAGITLSAIDTTIAPTGIVNTQSGPAVYGSPARDWTLVNEGTLQNTVAGYNQAVGIASSAYLLNTKGALITADFTGVALGGFATGQNDTLVNDGTIFTPGTATNATAFFAGYTNAFVTNQSDGLIEGKTAVDFEAGGTLVNQGTIATTQAGGTALKLQGNNDSALVVDPGSTLIGSISGFIEGDTIDFAGLSITSEVFGDNVLTLGNAGIVLATLSLSGDMNTGEFTLTPDGGGGTAITLGRETLTANYTHGITLSAAFTTLAAGASIYVPPTVTSNYTPLVGVVGAQRHGQVFDNFGTVTDHYPGRAAVGLSLNGTVVNEAGGSISGSTGVNVSGDSYSSQGASIANAGVITGLRTGGYGVDISYGQLSNSNLGGIYGDSGVLLYDATVLNAGRIIGHSTAGFGVDIFGFNGTLINSQSGTIASGIGVTAGDYATIENAGTIIGSGGTAISFGKYDADLIVNPGAVFSGSIVTGGTIKTRLEFAAGIAGLAGTLAGIGESIVGFNTIVFDPGVQWTAEGDIAGLAGGQTIAGFTLGDTINLDGFDATGGSYFAGAGYTLSGGTGGATLDFTSNPAGEQFTFTTVGNNTLVYLEPSTACYCRGTRILTERGEVAVEALRIGDHVVTHAGALRPIRWIGTRSYAGRFAAGNREVLPVLFHAGALADGVPQRDLMVSPLHAMYLDGALVPAAALANGLSILQLETVDRVDYFHIELETHDVILAEGAPSESFVDDDSRGMFHNAPEYHAMYPAGVRVPARYCAPRLEEGEALEALRQRLAARVHRHPTPAHSPLTGRLDEVNRQRLRGWASDDAPDGEAVQLRILDNGVVIGHAVADDPRKDLRAAGVGDGRRGFHFAFAAELPAHRRHVIQVQREADSQELPNSPWVLAAAIAPVRRPAATAAALRGYIDELSRTRISGWVQDPSEPDLPVALQVVANGLPVARVLANRLRADLVKAGIGNGRHGFEAEIPGGLSPLAKHVVEFRRERDGAPLGEPRVIETARDFSPAMRAAIADAVAAAGVAEQEQVLSFIMAQAGQLLQRRADGQAQRAARIAHRQASRRHGAIKATAAEPGRRALVIDERLPLVGHDAGSQAMLSHMRALQRLGFAVSIAAAGATGANDGAAAALAAAGITCCGAPFYNTVEEVLRRQADCFDLVYLHRADIAAQYLALARRHNPRARIVYSVADLHHVRLERQAEVEQRPDLLAASRRLRMQESVAACSADAVITHSLAEAALLHRLVPEANVHHVPWDLPAARRATGFTCRRGLAFIGAYDHAPNVDAAHWLVEAVMPLVWQDDPTIECLLVGGNMPASLRRLARPGVVVLGHVEDLAKGVFDRVRLTVAPLRYGAGIKGKVVESFAAGVPCAMSPIAAEGLPLPVALQRWIGQDATALAALILRLHRDKAAHAEAANAGLAMIRQDFSASTITAALAAAVDGLAVTAPAPAVTSR